MAESRRVYLDSCCFIDMVKVTLGKPLTSDRELDVWHLKRLLEAHRDREIELFTSTLTIAECSHGGDGDLNPVVKASFNKMLCSGQYVRLVEMTPFIAQDARDLRWVHGIGLRGADSIHVASALDRKCEEFLSSNGKLERTGAFAGPLSRFGLYVKSARDTACLPNKYRQIDIDDDQAKH